METINHTLLAIVYAGIFIERKMIYEQFQQKIRQVYLMLKLGEM